ncbi:hypothetical protein FA13DRAFT_773106 [Coprinellus micaceus]|uniref:DUF6533 domain-containing protein n=1 Tax=Coprinellus micaceus TaxID=71717 RepID=A0A4Y7T338_COPMI|nr:hypothetical protein FA13DRAFT_773106 [Coprinellus micaceus]
MAISAEQIQALSDAITIWRRQESINIAFYCLYVYYVLTTVAEEIAIILPQRWNRGKMLYMICRYGLLVVIALEFSRDYRNYYPTSPNACKVLFIITRVVYNIFIVVCDFSLALCLGALLQAKALYLVGIVILSCGIPLVNAIFQSSIILSISCGTNFPHRRGTWLCLLRSRRLDGENHSAYWS